jgi:hypothetical protein
MSVGRAFKILMRMGPETLTALHPILIDNLQ